MLLDVVQVVRRYYDCEDTYVFSQYVVSLLESAKPWAALTRLLTPFVGNFADVVLREVNDVLRASEVCNKPHLSSTVALF